MKKLILPGMLLLNTLGLFAQKHQTGFEFYQPIQVSSMSGIYNDEWIFTGTPTPGVTIMEYNRHYFSNAIGLCFAHTNAKNNFWRIRAGLTLRDLHEYVYRDHGLYRVEAVLNYKQQHLNIFAGAGKNIVLGEKFSVKFGAELAFTYYLASSSTIDVDTYSETGTRTDYTLTTETGTPAWGIGAGPVLCPEYRFAKNWLVSAEVQYYLLYMRATGSTTQEVTGGGVTIHSSVNYDFRQVSFSRFAPLVRVGFEF